MQGTLIGGAAFLPPPKGSGFPAAEIYETEKEVIFRFQNLIKLYESQIEFPIYNEEELTITISLFKIPDKSDIPILLGCYEIEKYLFQKSAISGFVISNNDLKLE